jgi:AcrR family transcriptional regulator
MAGRVAARSLTDVATAAVRVLTAKGYRATGISDVSTALGLSHGALYTYVRSKEALLYLAMARLIRPELLDTMALPVQPPTEDDFVALARHWLDPGFPALTTALDRPRVAADGGGVRAELGGIVDELYAFIEGNRDTLALVMQIAQELPEMFQFWFVERRRGHFAALSRYLEDRIRTGHLRAVPDVSTAARFIAETVAWFAWHRKGDPDSAMLTDERCRATVRHLLLAAFLPIEGDR